MIPALVNGAVGALVAPMDELFSVMAFTVVSGRIARIDALVDPQRLAALNLNIPSRLESAEEAVGMMVDHFVTTDNVRILADDVS